MLHNKINRFIHKLRKYCFTNAVYFGNDTVLARVRNFRMLLPTADIAMTPHMTLDAVWEPMISSFFKSLIRKGDTVLDVGAAFGYYTLISALQVGSSGTVISVEADPRNFKILKKNIFMNGMSDRVIPVNKAASSVLGNAKLYYKSDDAYGNNTLLGESDEKNIDVETVSIDSMLTSLSIDRCDVVKIDVEGFEPFVVRGMINTIKSNPNIKIVLEFSPAFFKFLEFSPLDFIMELREIGFRKIMKINEFTGHLVNITDNDLNSDNLFMCYLEKQ